MPKALFCACNSWFNHSQVGSHHLARGLARKGWQVAFISDPVSPAHVLGGVTPELAARFRLWVDGGSWVEENIFTWLPTTLLAPHNKPLLRSEWVANNWHRLALPSILAKIRRAGFGEVDLLYIDSPTQAYWWKDISYTKGVYRLADAPSGFVGKHTHAAQRALQDAVKHLDALVYTAPSLRGLAESLRPDKQYLLPNGVDSRHFSVPTPCPPEYNEDNRPIVVYVGVMEEWFDFTWVDHAATQLPHYRFVLIGPEKLAKEKLVSRENVSIIGPRPFQTLPGYLQHASVGIVPFDTGKWGELIRSINPLKLYEYMTCGLPVVASRWETLEQLASPALLVDNVQGFCEAIQTAVEQKATLGALGREFALRYDWQTRVDSLLEILGVDATQ